MDTFFRLTGALPEETERFFLLKADVYSTVVKINELSTIVTKRINELKNSTQEHYEKRGKEGYDDGKAAGHAENAEYVLETVLFSVEFIEGIEDDLVKIVMETVRKILSEMNPEERIVRIVRKALSSVKSQKELVIRVSSSDEKAVSKNFSDTLKSTRGGFLNIIADARLESGSCLIETEFGVVDASLEVQLKALNNAFHSKIRY